MTRLLDQAVTKLRTLPPAVQDEFARLMLQMAGETPSPLPVSADEAASFDESLHQAEHGDFATEAEIHAIWAKHGL